MSSAQQVLVIFVVLLFGEILSQSVCNIVPTSSEPIRVIVPLYLYPGSAWDEVISAAATEIIAIVNPNSGPDPSGPDATYKEYMKKLQTAGITQIGYIHTSYGQRPMSQCTKDGITV